MNESERLILKDGQEKIDRVINRLASLTDYRIVYVTRMLLMISDFMKACEEE